MCHNFHIRGNSCLFLSKKKYNGEKTTYKEYSYKEINSKKNVTKKREKTAIVTPTKKKVSSSLKYIHYILVFLHCRCTTATNLPN